MNSIHIIPMLIYYFIYFKIIVCRSEKTIESIELLRNACAKDTKNPQVTLLFIIFLLLFFSYYLFVVI